MNLNLIQKIKNLEERIKELEDNNMTQKINNFENQISNQIEIINNLGEKTNNFEKEFLIQNKLVETYSSKIKERIDNLEKNKINEINGTIYNLLNYHVMKKYLYYVNSFSNHINGVISVKTFPSGNIVSTSRDRAIIIYDKYMNIIQKIQNAHSNYIQNLDIKDENNFVSSSWDNSIKTWIKVDGVFKVNKVINNAHSKYIIAAIYNSKGNIISCSFDYTIKIWEENEKGYQNIKTLKHTANVISLLLLEDKNLLISAGQDGTRFWDLNNNYEQIKYFNDTKTDWHNALGRIDDDRIVVRDKNSYNLKVISISQKNVIKQISLDFDFIGILSIKKKGIFMVGGVGQTIKIFRSDNYALHQKINNAHSNKIIGFAELQNDLVASYSDDNLIKIWSFIS